MIDRHGDPQRFTLRVLVAAQVLSGAGLAAGITVGALLAQDMLGTTSLAGLPSALFTIGSAFAALAVGRVSQARGRRPGLASGYLVGALGSAGVVIAAVAGSVALLLGALFIYGSGTATNLQARYAGADLAPAGHRGRAISAVLVATTLGAVIGPNLVGPMGGVAQALGIPRLAGPFILSTVAYAAAGIVLCALLRPDPLLLARSRAAETSASARVSAGDSPAPSALMVLTASTVMVVAQFVMVAIMTMTPVHMIGHGHDVEAAGLVIAVHVGAMFLPSPVSGWLVDRVGAGTVASAAGIVLMAAAIMAAAVSPDSVAGLAVALGVLGAGWSLSIVSGTAMLSNALPPNSRAQTQGAVDLAIAVAGAGGGLGSGILAAAAGYQLLALSGGATAMVTLVAVMALLRKAGPATAATGGRSAEVGRARSNLG